MVAYTMTAPTTDLTTLAQSHDIITLGMLADEARRARHGSRATYVRVADVPADPAAPVDIPPDAGEVRIVGAPSSLAAATERVTAVVAAAGGRPVTAYSLADLETLAGADGAPSLADMLGALQAAGLVAIAEAPFDALTDAVAALQCLTVAGLRLARLTIDRLPTVEPMDLLTRVRDLQAKTGVIRAFAPLPRRTNPAAPTTGFDDVKRVALARLVVDNVDSIQVDWSLYGPKLAQVALTVGADDLDCVSPTGGTGWVVRGQGPMSRVRVGAVSYLNTKPLVWGLETAEAFDLRFDVPSRCAALLHAGETDLGLIPSIEYLRGPVDYRIAPGLSLASRGAVDSVAIYTPKDLRDVRTVAMDTSSRTSAALVRVLCARRFGIAPEFVQHAPGLEAMLTACDAALLIGDNALFLDHAAVEGAVGRPVQKFDLGAEWFALTGLPFVYAFWAGRPGVLDADAVSRLQAARDAGLAHVEEIATRDYPGDAVRQATAARYLRDNMKYHLGADECAGLAQFYRYAAELQLVTDAREIRFF